MKIKLSIALVASVMVLSFIQVKAQIEPPTVMEKPATLPPASAMKAAEEMLIVSGASELFNKISKPLLISTARRCPQINVPFL